MATYAELREQDFKRQIEFNNIKKYHDAGFKGKGITVLNAEHDGDHREMTSKAFKDYAPDATLLEGAIGIRASGDKVIEATVNLNGDRICLEDAIDKYNIKIITRSYSGKTPNATLNYFKDLQKRKGVIFFNSAGNEGVDGVTGVWAKDDTAIAVGAAYLTEKGEVKLHNYSARGDELDFISFMARGTGTSAAAPVLASMVALLLQRFGDFNQSECVEILKSLCFKIPGLSKQEQGWGLPILPLTDKLEILERLRGENMNFKDVEQDRWSKNFIKICVDEGLLQGYPDGTFNPGASVTREELAVVLVRLLDKIEGRI